MTIPLPDDASVLPICQTLRATPDMYELLSAGASGMYGWPATKDNAQNVGYRSVGVPGAVGMLCHALERHGTLTREAVLSDAIRLAADGFDVDWSFTLAVATYYDRLAPIAASRRLYLKENGAPLHAATGLEPGDRFVQSDLAESLRAIAGSGPDALYGGAVGRAIVRDVQAHGGLLSEDDLAAFAVRESAPLVADYRGHRIDTLAGASGAVTLIEALGIIEGFAPGGAALDAATLHLLIEAQRRAFADRFHHLGDPAIVGTEVYDRLLSDTHIAAARASIDLRHATPEVGVIGMPPSTDCTTHVNVVDHEGRMVALTTTNGGAYGSGVVAAGTGIMLSNVMTWFDPRPGRANSVAGGKRILSAIAPLVISRGGQPILCAGAPGGRRIMSAMLHVVTNGIDPGLGPQDAVNSPRTHCESPVALVDSRIPAQALATLAAMGHRLSVKEETFASSHFARPSAIAVDGSTRRAGVGALKASTAIGVE
ncbi:MAG: hypothetical protein NVSMB8_00820 [Candidatus Limnocylindrales bacterium]